MSNEFDIIKSLNTKIKEANILVKKANEKLLPFKDYLKDFSNSEKIVHQVLTIVNTACKESSIDSSISDKVSTYFNSILDELNRANKIIEEAKSERDIEIKELINKNGSKKLYVMNDRLIQNPKFYNQLFNNHGQSDHFELKVFKVFNGFNIVNCRVIFWDKEKYPIEEIEKIAVPVIITDFPFCWNEEGTDFVNLKDMYLD